MFEYFAEDGLEESLLLGDHIGTSDDLGNRLIYLVLSSSALSGCVWVL